LENPPKKNRGAHVKAAAYFILGVALWFIVDFGTAGGFRWEYFETYGPTLLLFYLGYPAIFTLLIFGLKWSGRFLFLATLAGIFVVEVVFTGNPLVMTFPACLLGIPLAAAVYTPLTFFPLWIVNGEIRRRMKVVLPLALITAAVMYLTTFGLGK
jgi:hypothetical protein